MTMRARVMTWGIAGILSAAAVVLGVSCADPSIRMAEIEAQRVYPPGPQSPRVVALGNLRSGKAPSSGEVELALFFFGEEPEPPMAFIRPLSVSSDEQGLLVCDAAVGMAMRWDRQSLDLGALDVTPRPARPVVALAAGNGDVLIADAGGSGAVIRFAPDGRSNQSYGLKGEPYRPGGMVFVGDELWVTNVLGHRIEVFDEASGGHQRSLGRRGAGPAEFGLPLAMATTPDGNVCVVDSLNCRVQILDARGKFISTVGGPGDLVGTFGRPKGVAVGPDGCIFVTDAASQRVHAFDSEGRPLLAFGEPGSGMGALSVPGGICVTTECPLEDVEVPTGFAPEYFVLVAEQLLRPGIRVYAWGNLEGTEAERGSDSDSTAVKVNARGTVNPHWRTDGCLSCHQADESGSLRTIAAERIDAMCLDCHDGRKARAEAHPVGRVALTRDIRPPDDWPLNDGRIGCLTCHDIVRHCKDDARRPAQNAMLLRVFEPDQPLALCTQCHKPADSWRISPHKNLTASGGVSEQSCGFCHTQTPSIPADGRRTGMPMLHVASSQLCLTCHARHWDVSPWGHVDRPATVSVQAALAANSAKLPLAGDLVTCYSCHNPHERGLFPSDSALGAVSNLPIDDQAALRVPSDELCLTCHVK